MLAYKAVYLNHELLARVPFNRKGKEGTRHLVTEALGLSYLVLRGLLRPLCGALAQLGERLLCTQEVSGSIPLGSIRI